MPMIVKQPEFDSFAQVAVSGNLNVRIDFAVCSNVVNRKSPCPKEVLTVKQSYRDKAVGKIHAIKGAIRQKAGEISKDPDLAADGNAEKNAGKVQNLVGKLEKALGK
jgi:uncharacterized protein YjbJ (UPF0337 family)